VGVYGRVVVIGLFIASAASAAWAEGDEEVRARELYGQGQVAFEAGKFAEAARLFEESYQESRRPRLLWNAAQAYQKQYNLDSDLRNLRRARALYHNFAELGEAPQERADAAREEQAADKILREAERPPPAKRPLTRQWWFWTAIGAGVVVVATSVGLGVGLSQPAPAPRTAGGVWMPFP
jgi:tetratricopeptide (TPR) repeat protein